MGKKQSDWESALVEVADLAEQGVEGLFAGLRRLFGKPDLPAHKRLLIAARKRRKAMRNHAAAYVSVNAFLALVNVLTFQFGPQVLWFLFPAGAWGVGLAMHYFTYRGWLSDNRQALLQAESLVSGREALLPETSRPTSVPAEQLPADPEWDSLLARVAPSLDAAERELGSLGPAGKDALERLRAGKADVERLLVGERRLRAALHTLAPGGAVTVDRKIAELDRRLLGTHDERLRSALQSNRALLDGISARVTAIANDRERMRAAIEGFVLTAQSLHLDAARLGAGRASLDAMGTLSEPIQRLAQEVEILREVEAEMARITT